MGKLVLKRCNIEINAVDYSNLVHEVSIETERDEVDATGFQAENKETLAGLGDATIELQAYNDYAAAALDSAMFLLSKSDTPVEVAVRPTDAAVGAGNPEYAMLALLFNYTPISGGVGEMAETPLTFRNATDAGLTRAVA